MRIAPLAKVVQLLVQAKQIPESLGFGAVTSSGQDLCFRRVELAVKVFSM